MDLIEKVVSSIKDSILSLKEDLVVSSFIKAREDHYVFNGIYPVGLVKGKTIVGIMMVLSEKDKNIIKKHFILDEKNDIATPVKNSSLVSAA